MHTLIGFAILGLGIGAVYGLLGNGLVLIYRGSGVVNFAHGAMAMSAAYLFYEMSVVKSWPFWPAFIVSTLAVSGIGLATQIGLMRRLRNSSPLSRLIATLGILATLDGLFSIWFGSTTNTVIPPALPNGSFTLWGYTFSEESLCLLGIAVAICAVLYAWSRFTPLGLAMAAVAESPDAASTLGWSPQGVAALTWSVGAALAGVAGILIVPVSGLVVTNLTLIVVDALAAALLGGFVSFPIVLISGVVIGIVQSEMAYYVSQAGWSESFPFLVISVVLLIRGRGLPVRGHVLERLPNLGSGALRLGIVIPIASTLSLCIISLFSPSLTIAVTIQTAVAIILLSVIVVTGYAGQLSLAQYSLAGVGALVAGRIAAVWNWPFLLCIAAGVVAAALVGLIVGLPAIRTRGVNLAIVTLGLGIALEDLVFLNPNYTGGIEGTTVPVPTIFGLSLNPITDPGSYAVFCIIALIFAAIVVSNVRRSRSGRRLIAVRANERAAASLGINVQGAKLYAFSLGAGIAGLGGILLAFLNPVLQFNTFDPLTSVSFVGYATIGGLGHIAGTLYGSGFQPGGLGSLVLDHFGSLDAWLPLIGGIGLILILLQNPNGIAGTPQPAIVRRIASHISSLFAWAIRSRRKVPEHATGQVANSKLASKTVDRAESRSERGALIAERVTVRFGGVVAVKGVTLRVEPGEIVGLIGPNGAGKTTLIDAITGFVSLESGSVALGTQRLDDKPAYRRARLGLARTFQALELFEDFSVADNFRVASDDRGTVAYYSNLIYAGKSHWNAEAYNAIDEFQLSEFLERSPRDLPHGVRRLVGIARAVATGPAVLLLDEPAAGLNDTETAELARLIRKLSHEAGIGVLLVEHDMALVTDVCDRITVLNFGAVIADGRPVQILADAAVREAYLGNVDDDASPSSEDRISAEN